jgi:hypothetical protein
MTAAEDAWIDDATDEEIVHWYESRPVTVSAAAAGGSIAGAFALGVLVAVGALVVMGRLDLD